MLFYNTHPISQLRSKFSRFSGYNHQAFVTVTTSFITKKQGGLTTVRRWRKAHKNLTNSLEISLVCDHLIVLFLKS